MQHFGIIGYPLLHSFSAQFFNKKFREEKLDAEYTLYPLKDISEFPALIQKKEFVGMNVTMPYKESIITYLSALDESAISVGAVNVIAFENNGTLRGYNTDVIGFCNSIRPQLQPSDKSALILGTGGAAKAVACGLHSLGIETVFVSRSAMRGITYDKLDSDIVKRHNIIINCTPLGMVPETDELPPFPYDLLDSAHFLYDCIYNPEETLFLKEGKRRGCRTSNGIDMLYGQAHAAWNIWNN